MAENLERFSKAFTPVMHFFHNIASEVSKGSEFSLAQFRVLMIVYHYGPMSVNQLKNGLNIAQSTASELVERLVQQEMLYREKNARDRRITQFSLTEHAKKIIENQKKQIKFCYRKILEPLTPEEQSQLVQAFETIYQIVEKHSAASCN